MSGTAAGRAKAARARELAQQGWSDVAIAAELGVDAYTLDRYLNRPREPEVTTSKAKWDPDVEWKHNGLCTQIDNDLFFPEKGGSTREGKAICRICPVRQACLDFALRNDERFGIWGGLSERERRRLKRAAVAS